MKIIDRVYGEEEINEPILIDLINSKEIQRLKGISQFGLPDEYYHISGYSRYEHSIGVLILLKRLNADLKEQIAGLLHDISHTAFSHVVDWVIGDPTKEDYQDNIHLNIIKNSNIPKILEKYNINYDEISDLEDFSLLEKEAPSLCVDRIDYTLRELKVSGGGEEIDFLFKSLGSRDGQTFFKSKKSAFYFAKEYIELQNKHWAGEQARARYYLLAEILRKALDRKIISILDFNKTDKEVIDKLIDSADSEILADLDLLKKKDFFEISEVGVILLKKFRYVDPEVLENKEIRNLSEIFEKYKILLNEEKRNSNNKIKIKILK